MHMDTKIPPGCRIGMGKLERATAKQLLCGCLFVSFAVIAGCTNLTEYDMALSAGLHIISPEDFTVIETIPDIEGARSLLLHSGNVFVVSTEGMIFRYDAETMELVDQSQIGSPSPAGYSDAVYSTTSKTAYIIGSYGNILELSLPECTVVDQFSVCQSPIKLATGADSPYLFVADGPSSRVYQVRVDGNRPGDNVPVCFSINHMAPCQNPDSMLVATTDGISLVSVLSPVLLRVAQLVREDPYVLMAAIPEDTMFVGVRPFDVGMLDVLNPVFPPPPSMQHCGSISGDPFRIAISGNRQCAYILTHLAANNTSRLYSYNYGLMEIDRTLDIPGYPLDLEVIGGAIYVLTTE